MDAIQRSCSILEAYPVEPLRAQAVQRELGQDSGCLSVRPPPPRQDIQQLLQLQQLVLVPGHHLQPPAQFLLPQAQQSQPGKAPPRRRHPLPGNASTELSLPPHPVQSPCLSRPATDAKSLPATSANPGSSSDLPAPGRAAHTGENVHRVYQAG